MNGEEYVPYKIEKTEEISFGGRSEKPTPPTICPYCHGMGYTESGDDTHECRICKGSGRTSH
jgi:DnaJ-class molecular chaperone